MHEPGPGAEPEGRARTLRRTGPRAHRYTLARPSASTRAGVPEPVDPFTVTIALLVVFALLAVGGRRRLSIGEARALLERGDLDGARKAFLRLARQRNVRAPGREAALCWLGRTLEAMDRPADARRVYVRYLRDYDGGEVAAKPELLGQVRARLAGLLAQDDAGPSAWGRFLEAKRAAAALAPARAEGEAPVDPVDDIHVGRLLLEQGRHERAREVFLRYAREDDPATPGREQALVRLGETYEALGQRDMAVGTYRLWERDYVEQARDRKPSPLLLARVRERLAALGEAPLDESPWSRFQRQAQAKVGRLLRVDPTANDLPVLPSLDGPAPADPAALARDRARLDAGLRLGPYVLAEKLGEGGMGEVFRALRPVAVKLARDPASVERLQRFAAGQGKVQSPHVVRPLEVRLEADPPYVVMELVQGPTLRELLRAHGKLEPAAALATLRQVALGLRDAHAAGVLHLDLKPENVLLDADGTAKLTDFEAGRADDEQERLRLSLSFRSGELDGVAGTLAYMSPEQRDGRVPDARSDVYTFGVMLFETLTGTLPEPGDKPSEFVPGLPAGVDRVFERCFARLERRYPTVAELVADLDRALEGSPRRADLARLFAATPQRTEEGVPRALTGRLARAEAAVAAPWGTEEPAGQEAAAEPQGPAAQEPEEQEAAPERQGPEEQEAAAQAQAPAPEAQEAQELEAKPEPKELEAATPRAPVESAVTGPLPTRPPIVLPQATPAPPSAGRAPLDAWLRERDARAHADEEAAGEDETGALDALLARRAARAREAERGRGGLEPG